MAFDTRRVYMNYWRFSPEKKAVLIQKFTDALPTLRGTVKATQDEIANATGVSRQTYNAIEMHKRRLSWNTYMSLILFLTIQSGNSMPFHTNWMSVGYLKRLKCWMGSNNGRRENKNGTSNF